MLSSWWVNTHLRGTSVACLLAEYAVEGYRGVCGASRGERQRKKVGHRRPTLVLQCARRLRGLGLPSEIKVSPVLQRARRLRRRRLLREIEYSPVRGEEAQSLEGKSSQISRYDDTCTNINI